MFSSRTSWDLSVNRLSRRLEEIRRSGAEILDLTETNPTRVGLPYPAAEILRALAVPAALQYDPSPRGLRSARAAVASIYAERGIQVGIEQLFLTASTSEAYAWLFKLLADPGDEVLVPRPSYPLFDYLARLESVTPVAYPLTYDRSWTLDVSGLAGAVGRRTRAVVVVSPNNPTGSYLKREELGALASLCRERDLALIGDEVFAEYPVGPDPGRASSVLEAGDIPAFSLGGLSKLAGLPQLKLGWIAVGGEESERSRATERLETIADTYLSVNTPVQAAAPALLELAREVRFRIRERLGRNRKTLADQIRPDSPCRPLSSEGGWSVVLQVPAIWSEEQWVLRLLEEDRVLVHPGYFFDFPTPAYLVLSLLPPEPVFRTGLERILVRSRETPG